MSLTKDEVEAARERIWRCIIGQPSRVAIDHSKDDLDALCAAAVTDDLVGRRISFRAFGTQLIGTVTKESKMLEIRHNGSQAGPCGPGTITLFEGDEFELVGADDDKS